MASKTDRKSRSTIQHSDTSPTTRDWTKNLILASLSSLVWILTGAMLAGRFHLAYRYTAISGLPFWAEPFVAPGSCLVILLAIGTTVPIGLILLRTRLESWTGEMV